MHMLVTLLAHVKLSILVFMCLVWFLSYKYRHFNRMQNASSKLEVGQGRAEEYLLRYSRYICVDILLFDYSQVDFAEPV